MARMFRAPQSPGYYGGFLPTFQHDSKKHSHSLNHIPAFTSVCIIGIFSDSCNDDAGYLCGFENNSTEQNRIKVKVQRCCITQTDRT